MAVYSSNTKHDSKLIDHWSYHHSLKSIDLMVSLWLFTVRCPSPFHAFLVVGVDHWGRHPFRWFSLQFRQGDSIIRISSFGSDFRTYHTVDLQRQQPWWIRQMAKKDKQDDLTTNANDRTDVQRQLTTDCWPCTTNDKTKQNNWIKTKTKIRMFLLLKVRKFFCSISI